MPVAQERIRTCTLRLIFMGDRPEWLRVYEFGTSGATKLLKAMGPSHATLQLNEYLDIATGVPAQSARVYLFRRPDSVNLYGSASRAA
jgi:hypothetical protein